MATRYRQRERRNRRQDSGRISGGSVPLNPHAFVGLDSLISRLPPSAPPGKQHQRFLNRSFRLRLYPGAGYERSKHGNTDNRRLEIESFSTRNRTKGVSTGGTGRGKMSSFPLRSYIGAWNRWRATKFGNFFGYDSGHILPNQVPGDSMVGFSPGMHKEPVCLHGRDR